MIQLLLLVLALTGLEAVDRNGDFDIKLGKSQSFYGTFHSSVFLSHLTGKTAICFGRAYAEESKNECIIINEQFNQMVTEMDLGVGDTLRADIRTHLPKLPTDGASAKSFKLQTSGAHLTVIFIQSRQHGGVLFEASGKEFNGQILVNGVEQKSLRLSGKSGQDLSGCRATGSILEVGKSTINSNCQRITCSAPGSVVFGRRCQAGNTCFEKTCVYKTSCTFTGPSVIDIEGKLKTIRDRCKYTLMKAEKLTGFVVSGHYRERRLSDVSFLDSIVVYKDSDKYTLKQSGIAMRGEDTLELTDTLKAYGPLSLAKKGDGIIVQYTAAGVKVSIFFDGYTAQIHNEGPEGSNPSLGGLCADANARLDGAGGVRISDDSCRKVYPVTNRPAINCDDMKAKCAVLKSAPFSNCNSRIRADSFVKACEIVMCQYPDVDNVLCYTMDAYVRACKLFGGEEVKSFRATFKCPATHEMYCKDKMCSHHEFCAVTAQGNGHRCLCRDIFASPYRSEDKLGDAAVCEKGSATATLIKCLLEEKGIDYNNLHLNDGTCKGNLHDGYLTFGFSKDQLCGTTIREDNGQLIYTNNIKSASTTGTITRQDIVNIPFSCIFAKPDKYKVTFSVSSSSIVSGIDSSDFSYTLEMKAYADAAKTTPASSTELNKAMFVVISSKGLSNLVAVVAESCFATKASDPTSTPKHYLIQSGCANAADGTVQVVGNGLGTSVEFSFKTFQFVGSSSDVFLHCEVKLCSTKDNNCAPTCPSSRRRRDAIFNYKLGESALLTMSWTS